MADFVALATKFVEFLPEIARTRSTTRWAQTFSL